MKLKVFCQYGNHDCEAIDLCYYTDLANGVASNTPTCRACYEAHILKYYPNSRMASRLTQRAADASPESPLKNKRQVAKRR